MDNWIVGRVLHRFQWHLPNSGCVHQRQFHSVSTYVLFSMCVRNWNGFGFTRLHYILTWKSELKLHFKLLLASGELPKGLDIHCWYLRLSAKILHLARNTAHLTLLTHVMDHLLIVILPQCLTTFFFFAYFSLISFPWSLCISLSTMQEQYSCISGLCLQP